MTTVHIREQTLPGTPHGKALEVSSRTHMVSGNKASVGEGPTSLLPLGSS